MIGAERHATHGAILLLIRRLLARSRKLSLFPHWHKGRAQSQSDKWADKEPSRVQANDDIHLLAHRFGYRVGSDVVDKVGDECLECDGVTENGEDVEEDDTLAVPCLRTKHRMKDKEDILAWGNLGIW